MAGPVTAGRAVGPGVVGEGGGGAPGQKLAPQWACGPGTSSGMTTTVLLLIPGMVETSPAFRMVEVIRQPTEAPGERSINCTLEQRTGNRRRYT